MSSPRFGLMDQLNLNLDGASSIFRIGRSSSNDASSSNNNNNGNSMQTSPKLAVPVVASSSNPGNGSVGSISPASQKSPKTLKPKKTVSFTPDTIIHREDNIALSIVSHKYVKEIGFTQYEIALMFRGIKWVVKRRYRDFESMHKALCEETSLDQVLLPELPKKRWFERQRWLNRFDESYSMNRRLGLQDYLRALVRTLPKREKSDTLREFLEIPPEALAAEEEYASLPVRPHHTYKENDRFEKIEDDSGVGDDSAYKESITSNESVENQEEAYNGGNEDG